MTDRQIEALDALRQGREDTLALVEGLDQQTFDAVPAPGRWSVGEVLDHLVRADEMFTREIRVLAAKAGGGRKPFVYRSLRDIGAPFSWLPLPLRMPVEVGMVGWNLAILPVAREWLLGQRKLRVTASKVLQPEAGRGGDTLRSDLRLGVTEIERLVAENELAGAVYYSPIAGFSGVDGLIRLIASHERRHQEQIREVLAALRDEDTDEQAIPDDSED